MKMFFLAALLTLPMAALAGSDTVKPKGKPGTQYPVRPVQELTCAQAKKYIKKYGFYWSGAVDLEAPVPIYGFIGWWDKAPICKGRSRIEYHFRYDVVDADQQPHGVCLLGYYCVSM